MASFDALVSEAAQARIDGWDFSWLDGRATEERPSWGYSRLASDHMARAAVALDLQTGGGEVVAGLTHRAPQTVVTESWPPNVRRAAHTLAPLGVTVVHDDDHPSLPFRSATFDLVTSRHPTTNWWPEISRVLRPGGRYLSQQVGNGTVRELSEFFLGPLPPPATDRTPEGARAGATAAGLDVVDLRAEDLADTFFDVGAVVYYLRLVVWAVPGFDVARHRDRLRAMHDRIEREGPFVATAKRFLIEARKPV